MKKLLLISLLALAACDEPEQVGPNPNVEIVDDCPEGVSENGEPCK